MQARVVQNRPDWEQHAANEAARSFLTRHRRTHIAVTSEGHTLTMTGGVTLSGKATAVPPRAEQTLRALLDEFSHAAGLVTIGLAEGDTEAREIAAKIRGLLERSRAEKAKAGGEA